MKRRALSISRDILDDERIAALSDTSWRRFMSIWALADDQGNLSLNNALTERSTWRHAEMGRPPNYISEVREMVAARVLVPYAKNGDVYIHISAWDPRLSKKRPSAARAPNQADADESLPDWFRQLMESR